MKTAVQLKSVAIAAAAVALLANQAAAQVDDAGAAAAAADPAAPAPAESQTVARKPFKPTQLKAKFIEQFGPNWSQRWSASQATKVQSGGDVFAYDGRWVVEEPTVFPGLLGDAGLVAKSKAAQHAISASLDEVVDMAEAGAQGKPLVVQYEVKLQNGLSCGGAYLKLLTESPDGIQAKEFSDKTPYTIMFGPDKCGTTNKVHFIFRHKNPVSGELEEKHLKSAPYPKISKTTSLYTLVVRPDNTFNILINGESKRNGTLLDDFDPPVNPPKEIADPDDKKPADWVDQAKIPDPKAKKPADWDEDAPVEIPDEDAEQPEGWLEDEPLMVPDPDAVKPEEWDDEEDGTWVAPQIPNPKCDDAPGCGKWVRPMKKNPAYKGKWSAPFIDNPAYKGVWAPRKIKNPNYFEDLEPYKFSKIGGIGFEIWTMDEDILFDNIYIGHSEEDANAFAQETFFAKLPIEQNIEKKEEDATIKQAADEASSLVNQVREKVTAFVDAAFYDPISAVKEMPDVAGGLAAVILGLVTLLGILGGLIGGNSASAKAAVDDAKKTASKAAEEVKKTTRSTAAKAKSTAVEAKETAKKRAATVADEDDDEDDE